MFMCLPNSRDIACTLKNRRKLDPKLVQFGDLVTSTAKELNHPHYISDDIDPGYILFGVVRGVDKDTVIISLGKVEHVFLKDESAVSNNVKVIEYADRTLVQVVEKLADANLEKINNFYISQKQLYQKQLY